MKKVTLPAGAIIETLGNDVLVIRPGQSQATHLRGEHARCLDHVRHDRSLDAISPRVLSDLITRGLLVERGVSRRTVIGGGVAGVGAGLVTLSLPTVAAASSIVTLEGSYDWEIGQNDNRVLGLFAPRFGQSYDFPNTGTPSSLRLSGLDAVAPQDVALSASSGIDIVNGVVIADGNGVDTDTAAWRWDSGKPQGSNTIDDLNTLYGIGVGETLSGTFTWGTTTYNVTFHYNSRPN